MKKLLNIFGLLTLLILSSSASAAPKAAEKSEAASTSNQLFAYPHMLPSPFTLPAGRFIIGTTMAYGLTDFATISTDVFRDFYKVYNAGLKLSMFDFQSFAFALTAGVEHYNYKDIYIGNPDVSITSYLPGAVAAFEILPRLALFTGGTLIYSKIKPNSDIETSGLLRGAQVEADLSWGYSSPSKRSYGNVLSTGVSYDISYKMAGVGLSHHWPGFQLGVHYYPSASRQKVQPIISGGAVLDL